MAVLVFVAGCTTSPIREAQTQLRAGNYEAALKTYDDGLKRNPEDAFLREAVLNAHAGVIDRLLAAAAEHAAGCDDIAPVALRSR